MIRKKKSNAITKAILFKTDNLNLVEILTSLAEYS